MRTPKVWQIACGEKGRFYEQLFFEHDVMFLGPAKLGPYSAERYDAAPAGAIKPGKLRQVRQFATKVGRKDIVVLRRGTRVIAWGRVEGNYFYSTAFDEVCGWDLGHCLPVSWQHQHESELLRLQERRPLFGRGPRKPAFSGVHEESVLAPLRGLFERFEKRKIAAPPPPESSLSPEQVSDALFREGLGHEACLQVGRALRKLRGLRDWYETERAPGRPTEHEIVAHMVVPLLLALGWSEQFLAVEWHKIDLAVFAHTPTDAESCRLVCEAKRPRQPLQDTVAQAIRYCKAHRLNQCHKILVTDGEHFSLYRRRDGEWEPQPSGYLSLRKLRSSYLFPKGTDAIKTLMALTPAHIAR